MAPASSLRSRKSQKIKLSPKLLLGAFGLIVLAMVRLTSRVAVQHASSRVVVEEIVDTKGDVVDSPSLRQEVTLQVPENNNNSSTKTHPHLWDTKSSFPEIIKEYLTWATQQQSTLTEANWKNHTYLVLQCLESDDHCGGASDRLKPLPLMILLAYRSRRLFFIRWTRPCPLQEFLVPPAGGYNWTVPEWLHKHLDRPRERGPIRVFLKGLVPDVSKSYRVVRARLQAYDGGGAYFNEHFNGTGVSYDTLFHDLFRTFFTPSPPIAKIIQEEMQSVGLTPGNYATAHYRAFYFKKPPSPEKIAEWAVNSVNCASILRPGGPIYFASDSVYAVEVVNAYARNYSRHIVTIPNKEPLHLDKADNVTSRHPSDFYSVFIDLFLLGMGRCASVGPGGFGKFGLLLSYNASCSNRHIYRTHKQPCKWTDGPASGASAIELTG